MATMATLLRAVCKASLASRAAAAAASRAAAMASRSAHHAKTPTNKDMESDEAVWALYERWCKVFKKQRDHAQMARRFKIFKCRAEYVHDWNTYVPEDPEEAAIHLQKRREAKLLLSKGEDVSHFDEWHVPYQLGLLADGGDPFLRECDYNLLKLIEASEACSAVKDVIVE
ncbi:unnamed protein product [Miscanthus lutarioriparius]|uniref:Uncharacterized protein n=1 Tax=Miscanthus lutarioriparius TaxID=422564 RepID=A0A811R1J1_9POAL|nr:unnamed protein product [Miscanthus lutarioriparius]